MTRWTQVLVLVALSLVLGGSRCGEDEAVALEALRQDVAPPFDYALYRDASGRLAGKNADVLLVHRAEHLERVYADAQRGDARARALFLQLETQVRASGEKLAAQSLGLACTSLPACTVRWQVLDELMPSRGAGGMRLRHLFAEGFAHEARLKGVENTVIAAVLDVLLVGSVLESAAGRAVQAEARAGLTEAERLARGAALEARLAEGMSLEEAAALEARLAEAEALESGARLPARLEELARHRPSGPLSAGAGVPAGCCTGTQAGSGAREGSAAVAAQPRAAAGDGERGAGPRGPRLATWTSSSWTRPRYARDSVPPSTRSATSSATSSP